jgi:pyrimidine-nucleoside phosphorylase
MVIPSLIERKRDGGSLTPDEWKGLIEAYTAGRVPDYQMSALLMAVVWRGLAPEELAALTDAMLNSGERLKFDGWATPRVDKHSTGGVGDKVSIVLAPLVAACGVAVPMMSGRGLGHTGGTLDKLEAIPGFRTGLSMAEAEKLVRTLGVAMLAATPEVAPADKKLYALRDVSGTVAAIPLITASILSKKLAEGLTGLVLDVKTGSGAFIPELDRSLELATTMIETAERHGVRTVALVTAMDRPLGRACGNALEIEECINTFHGQGPEDLLEVTYALGVEMLLVAGIEKEAGKARARLEQALSSGKAAEIFARMVEAQGGDPRILDDPGILPQAAEVEVWRAPRAGTVLRVEPKRIGQGVIELGGGRTKVEDLVEPGVGFVISARPGDRAEEGEPLASVFAKDAAGLAAGMKCLAEAITIGTGKATTLPLVSHRVTKSGVEVLRQ